MTEQFSAMNLVFKPAPTEAERRVEYEICQKRGHQAHPNAAAFTETGGMCRTWYTCRWCGTGFATTTKTETTVHERNVPSE